MIRRLHFEEAQPSPQAINPAGQTAETRDGPENSSLAIEFKELLEQISGGMAAVSDQAMAVGLALAQSAPVERTVRHDLNNNDISHDARDAGDDKDLLDNRDFGQKDSFVRMDNDDSGTRTEIGATPTQDDGEDSGASATLESTGQEYLANKDTTQMVEVETLQDVAQELLQTTSEGDQKLQVDISPQTQAIDTSVEIAPVQMENAADGDQRNVGTFDVQTQVVAHSETRLKSNGAEKPQEVEEDPFDVDAVNTATVETGVDSLRKLTGPVVNEATQDQRADSELPVGQNPDVAPSRAKEGPAFGKNMDPQEEQGNSSMLAQKRDVEGGQKTVKLKSETSSHEAETVSPPITKMANRAGEGTIQMTLLRQAFESLRATRQDGVDGRAKPSSPQVAGVGPTAEAKAAQNESSSRASRSMTKPQAARMLERVEATLREAARARDGKTISLRLDPANLGRVKVDVSLRDGSLHARISPENQQVMVALRENAHDLQGALRKLGLQVDSVSVTVTSEYVKEETTTGKQTTDGRSFQQERNKMPQETRQVPENTSGNELAGWREVQTPGQANAVVDHWVA